MSTPTLTQAGMDAGDKSNLDELATGICSYVQASGFSGFRILNAFCPVAGSFAGKAPFCEGGALNMKPPL